ncbi:AAA family ATPase [Mycolicibacterium baixiangningiae]|uniref:AAA family ATPase n=1 Tax=Mycolicibacterium baixiangningiae TaxID=2761578 RepID=UPI001868DFFC|nr:LuxR family transcriptional regulator [Mycolicibacterium baixiangningiae]
MLAGREQELHYLTAALSDAQAGHGRVVVLRGEAGVGKSALLSVTVAAATDMTVLRTRGVEAETDLPFAALHRLLRPALHHIDRLPQPQADALRTAFGIQSGRADDRFVLSLAVLNLIAELADERPVLCAIDDTHWLDTASADALTFTARRLDAERAAMVLAARDGATNHLQLDDLPTLHLTPLGLSAATQLLRAEVGSGVHPDVCVRLATAAGGNPLALVELARALSLDQLTGRQPLPAPLPVTAQIESTFLQQVRRLPPDTQRMLLAAAADDTGRLATVLAAARRLGVDDTALGAAERSDILRVADGGVNFRHPLLRSAIYQGATFSDRQAAHRALADALNEGSEPDRRAWHLAAAAAGPDADIADALEDAASRADRRGAFAAAASALERSAELAPDADQRAQRLSQAAERAWRANQHDRAARLLDRAAAVPTTPAVRSTTEYLRGMAQLAAGMSTSAYRIVRDAAEGLAATDPVGALQLLLFAAEAASNATDVDALVSVGSLASELRSGDTARERFFVDILTGTADHFAGRPAGAVAPLRRAIAAAADFTEPPLLMVAGRAGLYVGDDEAAHHFSSLAVELARVAGEIGLIPVAGARAGLADILAGRWAAGEAAATEAVGLADAIGQPTIAGHGLACLALHAAVRGHVEQCQAYAERVLALAASRPMSFVEDWVRWALGVTELARERPRSAFERLRDIRHPVVIVFSTLDRIESAARADEPDTAQRWITELDDYATASEQPWALARLAHGRALLADMPDAQGYFDAALEHHRSANRPFERARTQLEYGASLRRTRRRTAAREHLQAAFDTFDALGADPWSERAQVELRACGQSVRKRDDTASQKLTPQETQVAGFVAQGLTNADVAAKLFLSRRTIDFHLRNVFTKLGVTSRTELARVLADVTTP